jgi:hypothetical protein
MLLPAIAHILSTLPIGRRADLLLVQTNELISVNRMIRIKLIAALIALVVALIGVLSLSEVNGLYAMERGILYQSESFSHRNFSHYEDDQAVLTDFMYHNPEAIVLDYGQTLFGNNRGGIDDVTNVDTCMFALLDDAKPLQRLYHTKTQTSPLFVHSPGGYLECHDKLAKQLGYRAVAVKSRRLFQKSIVDGRWVGDKTGCNYARICLGKGTGFLGLGFGYDKPRFGS